MTERVAAFCEAHGIPFDAQKGALLERYAAFLAEYNQNVNLTAVDDPDGIEIRHFCDSLCPLCGGSVTGSVLDVGSGAGFPGVVLKIFCPEIQLTLLDSNGKKIEFLRQLTALLGLEATLLYGRAEELASRPDLRDAFDLVVARAVAPLDRLCEYCLPFVKVGGYFLAMKGREHAAELQTARRAVTLLSGEVHATDEYLLPDGSLRGIIRIKKITQTSPKYPRNGSQMAKKPL